MELILTFTQGCSECYRAFALWNSSGISAVIQFVIDCVCQELAYVIRENEPNCHYLQYVLLMLIKLMSQSPRRSISEPEFTYPAYLVLCPNRDPYFAPFRANFNHITRRHERGWALSIHRVNLLKKSPNHAMNCEVSMSMLMV